MLISCLFALYGRGYGVGLYRADVAAPGALFELSAGLGEGGGVIHQLYRRAGERALMSWGSVAYSVCTLIVFGYCIRMTQKMSQDKDPFNAENVSLLRRMALIYGVELQQLSDETL